MEEYARITRQLVQLYNGSKGGFSDPERARKLLLVRKNILHKARNKMDVFRQIIQEIGEDRLKYCFVYSAAGKRTRFDEADDEAIDEYILKQMQGILKYTFPNTTCNSYTGVDSKAMRKHKLEAFANGQLNVLFAKNCLDEGVDVPRAEYGIFTSSTGNPRQLSNEEVDCCASMTTSDQPGFTILSLCQIFLLLIMSDVSGQWKNIWSRMK